MSLHDAVSFGCLNQKISQALKRLKALPEIEFEGIVSRASLEKAGAAWKKSGRSTSLLVDVNVYGPSTTEVAKSAGRILSNARLFLQSPSSVSRLATYDNPQSLKLPDLSHMHITHTPSPSLVAPVSHDGKDTSHFDLESILDNIPQSKVLREVSTSWRIRTALKKYVLITVEHRLLTMRSYQREAVDFLVRRETGDLPPSLSLWKPFSLPGGIFW